MSDLVNPNGDIGSGETFGYSDEEPSIIAYTNGSTYHVSAWQKRLTSPFHSRFYLNRYIESGGTVTPAYPTVSLPSGYTDQADPTLGVNPYNQGVRPYGVYLSGLVMNRNSAGYGINPMSVRVWVSSNGGATFDSVGMTVYATEGANEDLDKPTLDVSWYAGTLGYVYVTFVEWGLTHANRILLKRSPSGVTRRCRPYGGGCIDPFDPVVVVHDGSDGSQGYSPAVVVNSDNGNVYVVFTNNNGIQLKVSRDAGVSFPGSPIRIASVPSMGLNYTLPGGYRAPLIPMARYNPITHRLMVTWHGASSAGNADVYYTDFDADSVTAATMPAPTKYSASYDQYGPAVDNDDSGNALIAYYDNAIGAGFSYAPYGRYVAPGGSTVYGPAMLNYSGLGGYQAIHVGDYHEVFYWGTRWNNTWVRRNGDASMADIFATGIR